MSEKPDNANRLFGYFYFVNRLGDPVSFMNCFILATI